MRCKGPHPCPCPRSQNFDILLAPSDLFPTLTSLHWEPAQRVYYSHVCRRRVILSFTCRILPRRGTALVDFCRGRWARPSVALLMSCWASTNIGLWGLTLAVCRPYFQHAHWRLLCGAGSVVVRAGVGRRPFSSASAPQMSDVRSTGVSARKGPRLVS